MSEKKISLGYDYEVEKKQGRRLNNKTTLLTYQEVDIFVEARKYQVVK